VNGYQLYEALNDIDLIGARTGIMDCSLPVVLSNDITGRYETVTNVTVQDHYGVRIIVIHADNDAAALP
jgi:hypothetical protein